MVNEDGVDTTNMTEDEMEELGLDNEEPLDETLSEDFIGDIQREAVSAELPQQNESLDDFIARKEQNYREQPAKKFRLKIGGKEV